jgi:hypothetical protein
VGTFGPRNAIVRVHYEDDILTLICDVAGHGLNGLGVVGYGRRCLTTNGREIRYNDIVLVGR